MKLLSTILFSSALLAGAPAFACGGGFCLPAVTKGHFEVRTHKVQAPGSWVYETQQVPVPGRWTVTSERVLVAAGHHEFRTRNVTVPGRWVTRPCACNGRTRRKRSRRSRRHHRVRVNFGHGSVTFGGGGHRCAPVKRWIPPTCKQVSEKVWIAPVYQNRSVRKWIAPCTTSQQVRVWKPGCWETRRQKVWIAPQISFRCS